MKALVVDDSRAMRMVVRRILTSVGFEVVEAGNGEEALAVLAASQPVDIALIDWNMPVMNGLEFVVAVRGMRKAGEPMEPGWTLHVHSSKGELASCYLS